MFKKKSKFKKRSKEFFKKLKEIKFTKHYFYYTVLILIIIILSVFLFSNYNRFNVYEVNGNKSGYSVANGLLVMTSDTDVLRLSDISYSDESKFISSATVSLYVKVNDNYDLINSFSSSSADTFNLNDYLKTLSFDVDETSNSINVFTKEVKANIKNNLYLKIVLQTSDGNYESKEVKLNVNTVSSSTKLFY